MKRIHKFQYDSKGYIKYTGNLDTIKANNKALVKIGRGNKVYTSIPNDYIYKVRIKVDGCINIIDISPLVLQECINLIEDEQYNPLDVNCISKYTGEKIDLMKLLNTLRYISKLMDLPYISTPTISYIKLDSYIKLFCRKNNLEYNQKVSVSLGRAFLFRNRFTHDLLQNRLGFLI